MPRRWRQALPTAELNQRLADALGVDPTELRGDMFQDREVLSRLLHKPLSYDMLAKAMTAAKALVPDLNYGKVTHFKGDSIRNVLIMADGLGMREDCRVFGRWNKSATSFDKNYAWDLPTGPLLAVAGFNPRYPAEYDVPRAYDDPQLAEGGKFHRMLLKVFPWLDEEIKAAALRERGAKAGETDVTLGKFLEYLVQMRLVFLQDSAVLQDIYPTLCSFDHPVFQDEAWPEYKQSVLDRVANASADRAQGQVAKAAASNQELAESLTALLHEIKTLREGMAARDKLLQHLVFYFARTSGQVLQLTKGTEVMRQQHALLMSMLSSNPSMIGLRNEAVAQAGAIPSPLRTRPPLGASSPGAGAGRAPPPKFLRLLDAKAAGGAAMAATSAAATDAALQLTAAGEGSGAGAAADGAAGQPDGVCVKGAPMQSKGACRSAAMTVAQQPLDALKVNVGACTTVKALLEALLPVDAARRKPGGWGNVSHLIHKGVASRFRGFISRYKARDALNHTLKNSVFLSFH